MTNQNYQCVNTIGFIFDTAKVKIKQRKKKVPKSSNSSSLTTTYSTYKSKSDSSSTNSFYSSNSIYSSNSSSSLSSLTKPSLSSLTNSSYSSLTNSSYSLSDNSSSICLKPPKLPCLATSLFTNKSSTISNGCCKDTTNSKSLCSSDSSSTFNCLSSECNSSFFKNNDLLTNKSCKVPQKCDQNNLCIKPICYEPSICGGDNKCKKKCSHKNKKKFKTDIFNKLNKYCLIKLTKENFMSSTLSVCTDNKDECWIKFTENLYELLGGSFLITFTKCNIFRTLYCQLLKINYCACCQELKLFFKYNLLPPKKIEEECYNNINNIDLYYKLENCVYHNLRFYYDREYNFNPRNFINI